MSRKKYKGIVIRNFGFKGKKYLTNDTFEISSKNDYDHLINIKRIKKI